MHKYIDVDELEEMVFKIGYWDSRDEQVVYDLVSSMPAADVEPARKWIDVKEQLPEPGERTLIYAYDGHSMRISISNYSKKGYGWILSGTTAYWKVKAWMPLPEPPKMDGGSE